MLPYAEYLDDPETPEKLIDRLQRCLGLAHVVNEELRVIASASRALLPNYTATLDQMIAHLRIDIDYVDHAARSLLGG